MLPFQITAGAGVLHLAKKLRAKQIDLPEACDALRSYIDAEVTAHPALVALARAGMQCVCACPTSRPALVFTHELVCALEFAHLRPNVGRVSRCRKALRSSRVREAALSLLSELANATSRKGRQWFLLRALCMDIGCVGRIERTKRERIIFYGGASHARNIERMLLKLGFAECESSLCCKYADDVTMARALRRGSKLVVLL